MKTMRLCHTYEIETMELCLTFEIEAMESYGVATISRLLKMIGLFCKRAL